MRIEANPDLKTEARIGAKIEVKIEAEIEAEIEAKGDAQDLPTIAHRDANTGVMTRTPQVETIGRAKEKTDMIQGGMIAIGIETAGNDLAMMIDRLAGIAIYSMTEEVVVREAEEEVENGVIATDEKTATNSQLRREAARTALLLRSENPRPTSRILPQSRTAREG